MVEEGRREDGEMRIGKLRRIGKGRDWKRSNGGMGEEGREEEEKRRV